MFLEGTSVASRRVASLKLALRLKLQDKQIGLFYRETQGMCQSAACTALHMVAYQGLSLSWLHGTQECKLPGRQSQSFTGMSQGGSHKNWDTRNQGVRAV